MKRGQASVEFITIFGFVFLMMIPLVLIFFDQVGGIKDSIAENQLRNIALKIADKAETVYYAGEPSRTTIKVQIPENLESAEILSRTIRFSYRSSNNALHNVEAVSLVNISGNISVEPGIHYIELTSSGGEVSIAET